MISSPIRQLAGLLTPENFNRGFLIDDDLMAGVTQNPDLPGTYVAYVLRHATGEYLGYRSFDELTAALTAMNEIPRPWVYQQIGKCGEGSCGGGSCQPGQCGIGSCGPGAPST